MDLSSVQLDGSQTLAKNGGEAVGYHARKASKSSKSLFMDDNQCVVLCCSSPQLGQHHDLFEIRQVFDEIMALLKEAGIETKGLFLNADAGFDSAEFRNICQQNHFEANIARNPRNNTQNNEYIFFNEKLFKKRNMVEHANAWLDGFKTLLIRFEVNANHWLAFHFIAFTVLFIRKISKRQ